MKSNKGVCIDHGIAVKADELRSSAITRIPGGEYILVICSRGYILEVNLDKMKTKQVFFPEENTEYPYSSLCAGNGLVYTAAGKMFMEYDAKINDFSYYKIFDTEEEIAGFRFSEGENGFIYFGTYPSCCLCSYDPGNKTVTDYGSMDDTEMYMSYIAVDENNWVYMGIGTEKSNLVAFNPATGERRQLCREEERGVGSGFVYKAVDGNIYGYCEARPFCGYCEAKPLNGHTGSHRWKRFLKGDGVEINCGSVLPAKEAISCFEEHAPAIKSCSLSEHKIVYIHPVSKKETAVNLEYRAKGADISPLVAGPDGKVYGTSNHPLHFFSYDPKNSELSDLGGKVIEKGGGGNICAYAVQDGIIGGAAYAGGFIHIFDTSRPINLYEGKNRNPVLAAVHEEICRPRCAVAHSDGESMVFGGFAGYGEVGGGLCIYNVKTGADVLLKNEELLPCHSTLCMRILRNGNLIGGTSVKAPGGGHPAEREGEIYIMDWATKRILYRGVPIEDEPEISLMEIDDKERLHCITSNSLYFVFDPCSRKVLYKRDLSAYGRVVRNGLAKGNDGMIYGILSRAIFFIEQETYSVKILSEPQTIITSGIALLDNKIYFGSGPNLWSFGPVDAKRSI